MAVALFHKKGIFFTFMAITVMAVFILVFIPKTDVTLQKDTTSVEKRIKSLDSFIDDMENRYLKTVLEAVTHRAVLSMIFYINETGHYIYDIDDAFYKIAVNQMMNASASDTDIDLLTGKNLMQDNTLTNWTDMMVVTASDTLSINISIGIINTSIYQLRPWDIISEMKINFTIKTPVAIWEANSTITAVISIEDLYDPNYLYNTNGGYGNQIKRTNIKFTQWNISHTREHIRNGTYFHRFNSEAPSFLMRFTGNMSNSSCCGIESLVNPNKLAPALRDQQDSYVDYYLWTDKFSTNCPALYNITNPLASVGLWDEFWDFKLDLNHVLLYNITSEYVIGTCA